MWTLTATFEKEDLPERIQLEGLLYVCQTAEPASNDDVIELSVFWDNAISEDEPLCYIRFNLTRNKSPSIIVDKAVLAHGRCARGRLLPRNWMPASGSGVGRDD